MNNVEQPKIGALLVAKADSGIDFFTQSVVLLLDHDETGSLGVTLNKVSELPLEAVLPGWENLVSPPRNLFAGGPVSPEGAICLARTMNPAEEPLGWRRIMGRVGLLHLDTPVELVDGAFSDLRIYAGYAGWGPGQLEDELMRGVWYVLETKPEDMFSLDPSNLWRQVIRRQGGVISLTSTWVKDAELN